MRSSAPAAGSLGSPRPRAPRRASTRSRPSRTPGFGGFYAFRDEAEPDRAISVSLFDGREDAVRSHERVVGTAREELGEMACDTPEAAMGETVVLAAA